MKNVIAVVLAGGVGSRLYALTENRAKPAVEFAGKWRLIDFVMNNIFNSEIDNALVLTQTKSQSLIGHVMRFWGIDPLWNRGAMIVPAQQKYGEEWYRGTGDAVFQNLDLIESHKGITTVAILGADHIYKLDMRDMYQTHKNSNADFTICLDVILSQDATELGVVEVDENFQIIGFEEKPTHPKEIPGRPGYSYVSMGIYLAQLPFLKDCVTENAINPDSGHDFGKDIIPSIIKTSRVFGHDFTSHLIKGEKETYWRDVGTLRSFIDCHMDLVGFEPKLNLYNKDWPMRTYPDNLPPAKTVRLSSVEFFLGSGGCIIDAVNLDHVVLGRKVDITESTVKNSVIFSNVTIERNCNIQNAIIDKNVTVPSGTWIGFNEQLDKERGFCVKDGITIVQKGYKFPQ